jgi:hypothetical protein
MYGVLISCWEGSNAMFGGLARARAATQAATQTKAGESDRDPEEQRHDTLQIPDWEPLVSGVRDGDSAAMAAKS